VQLKKHIEAVQNVAIIKNIKVGGKDRKGRSTKTVEEEWDKKSRAPNVQTSGKYQKPPKKLFLSNNQNRAKQQKRPSINEDTQTRCTTSDEKIKENADKCRKGKQQDSSTGKDCSKGKSGKSKQEKRKLILR
jgi:hypothetical protein